MLNYDDVVLQIIALEKERNELRDLLCLYCGKEVKEKLGVCAGCKWNEERKDNIVDFCTTGHLHLGYEEAKQ